MITWAGINKILGSYIGWTGHTPQLTHGGMKPLTTSAQLKKAEEQFLKLIHTNKEHDFLNKVQLTSVVLDDAYLDNNDGLPVVVLRLKTSNAARDEKENIHIGALTAIIDYFSTLSQFAQPDYWEVTECDDEDPVMPEYWIQRIPLEAGVSRALRIHVLQPIPCETEFIHKCKILENTQSTCYLSVHIYSTDGKLLATGIHEKAKMQRAITAKL